jgi:hypothetical protein
VHILSLCSRDYHYAYEVCTRVLDALASPLTVCMQLLVMLSNLLEPAGPDRCMDQNQTYMHDIILALCGNLNKRDIPVTETAAMTRARARD